MITVPIFFAFDESMSMPAGVCITSLLESASSDTFYDIFILHNKDCNFSNSKILELPLIYKNCRITFREVNNEFKGAYEIRGITEATYYRLIVPELIPEYDKIIYSDVDVIFREDLSCYYNIDLGDNYFAGVETCSCLRPDIKEYIKQLGLNYRNGYYYAGNLIINSKLLLKDNKLQEFRVLCKNNYSQQDMDVINIACNGRFYPLSPVFCLTNHLYELIVTKYDDMVRIYGEEELNHALNLGIIHYNGPKPWKGACINGDLWWSVYRHSIFFNEKFCYDFWLNQHCLLDRLSLRKRIKLLLRYPLDKIKM